MNSQEHALTMSQNLASSYYDAAHFYIGKPESWLNKKPIFDGRAGFVKIPELRVKDIDTEDDWTIAEKLFSLLEKEE